MVLVKSLLVSSGEVRVHRVLSKYGGHFAILPKVRFFDVIDWNTTGISPAEHRYLQSTHFDFVICEDNDDLTPLFAVEFDGIGDAAQWIDPYRELKKSTKLRVCKTEGFPVLWLSWDEIQDIGGETVLDGILQHYVLYRQRQELITSGDWTFEDAPVHVFRPYLRLAEKYEKILMPGNWTLEKLVHNDTWVSATRQIELRTPRGPLHIARCVAMPAISFPYIHQMELVIDLATTRCLLALDEAVTTGRFRVNGDVVLVNEK